MTEIDDPLRITLIGGGGGGSVMAAGFVEVAEASGQPVELTVMTSIADSGSATGELRTVCGDNPNVGGPGVGDLRKILGAVAGNAGGELFKERFGEQADPESVHSLNEKMYGVLADRGIESDAVETKEVFAGAVDLATRLPRGLRGHTYGNLILSSMLEQGLDLTDAAQAAGQWLEAKASVLPVTTTPHHLVMFDGKQIIHGEGKIDEHTIADLSKTEIWLDPRPKITHEAYAALAEADVIALCPGSPFTSILPALSVYGVSRAIAFQAERHGTRRVAIANLIEERTTPGLELADYLTMVQQSVPLTEVVYNTNTTGLPEGRVPLKFDPASMEALSVRAIGEDLVDRQPPSVDPADPIRHLRAAAHHNPKMVAGLVLAGV